jgi:hypothetical protein
MGDFDEEEIVELNLICPCEQNIEYSVFTKMDGYLEEARYCPFCGIYNVEYDRVVEEVEN